MSTDHGRCEQGATGALGLTRRALFERMGAGLFGAALTSLSGKYVFAEGTQLGSADPGSAEAGSADPTTTELDLRARKPHFEPRAKSVIHLFMNGGPSQMDLFDPKPELDRHHGEDYFDKIAGEVENIGAAGTLLRSPFQFARHGQSGIWLSDAMPHLARQVDHLAVIRSMYTTNLTHEPALYLIHSGKMGPGRPALGSWVVYALGSENQNLPAYVVLDDPLGLPINGVENWQAGFLPATFQGTRFRAVGQPVLNLRPSLAQPDRIVQWERELRARLDQRHQQSRPRQSRLGARIASYELAARMQLEATDALDITQETQETLDLYGVGREPTDSYARRCLIARRLVERGVRFVQLYINGQIWDNHNQIAGGLKSACDRTDQPVAALLADLQRRGLFGSTLVVWGGEFGRLPIAQLGGDKDATNAGRDHNKNAFTTWMAGAGIRAGMVHGATDEIGLAAVQDRVSVPDWHATILHLLGLNYDQVYYEQSGLKEKLTGVLEARVVREILA